MKYIIIPIKSLESAKLRLAPILNSEQRRTLCINMFKDVIESASLAQNFDKIITVSSDPIILEIAEQFGEIINEPSETEINNSINSGIKLALQKNSDSTLIIPGDIPLITPEDIDNVLKYEIKSPTVIISPCLRKNGTNLLFLCPPNLFEIEYGEQSFQKHLKKAKTIKNINLIIYNSKNISLDIDLPKDIYLFLNSPSQTYTYNYLKELKLKNF